MQIRVEEVTKIFEDGAIRVVALDSVSLDIGQGEFVSIVGPSGCGKSTLLRMVAGLMLPTRGQVIVDGKPVDGPIGNVGFVFQTPVLFKWRTVLGNVLFPYEVVRSQGRPTNSQEWYEERARRLLQTVGLSGFEHAYPKQLSGGMQHRVSICRALLLDPPLLLMDEPFAALDEFTREVLNDELLKVWEQTQKTVLFVTHNIQEAVYLSDRVVVFSPRPGRVVADIRIDLPRPRRPEVRETVEFLRHVVAIRRHITAGGVANGGA